MTSGNPDIETRLRAHPGIAMRRSPALLCLGAGAAAIILLAWVLLLVNAAELAQQFAEHRDTAVTLNQRVGSRFGVLIGAVALPVLALLPLLLSWYFSKRYYRRDTGTRVRRGYRGVFPGTSAQGEEFQRLARTRDASVIGPMNPGVERGNLIVEAWAAREDRVGYVGTFAFDLREDPGWEIVEFAGPHFDDYEQIFGSRAGGTSGADDGREERA